MSAQGEELTDFERRARVALEESVMRIDGRVRSRLNQARQAAVEAAEARRGRPLFSRFFALVPTASAAAAALLVAVFLVHQGPQTQRNNPAVHEQLGADDLEMLADSDGLDLVEEGGDGSGSFYEWAADQTQTEASGGEKTDI